MVHDSEHDMLTPELVAECRDQWHPKNFTAKEYPDPKLRKIMLSLAEHYTAMPDDEFEEYVKEAYLA